MSLLSQDECVAFVVRQPPTPLRERQGLKTADQSATHRARLYQSQDGPQVRFGQECLGIVGSLIVSPHREVDQKIQNAQGPPNYRPSLAGKVLRPAPLRLVLAVLTFSTDRTKAFRC